MNKEKVRNFIKENWVPIALVTIAAVGTGTTVFLGIKSLKQSLKTIPEPRQFSELEKAMSGLMSDPKLSVATVTDAWVDDFCGDGEEQPWLILNELKVSDLGKLSEELIANVPGVSENTQITCTMGLL